ncbi:MAG: hypothetical protein GF365_04670 [Candidatus Buchananbacteria bacterium]|nr:hypothetical protein [Candidatus Buchananbacteria bacterium]
MPTDLLSFPPEADPPLAETAVFGMGTGVTLSLKSPDNIIQLILKLNNTNQMILNLINKVRRSFVREGGLNKITRLSYSVKNQR